MELKEISPSESTINGSAPATSIYSRESHVEQEPLSPAEVAAISEPRQARTVEAPPLQRHYLPKRFKQPPSPLKVGRVLTFLSSDLGFASPHTNVHRIKNFGWPQTEEEWEEADAVYMRRKPPILPMTLKYQLKGLKAQAQEKVIHNKHNLEKGSREVKGHKVKPLEVTRVKTEFLSFADVVGLATGVTEARHKKTQKADSGILKQNLSGMSYTSRERMDKQYKNSK